MIARDEEENIAACLDSARTFVDEVVVVDTGSTDRTRQIAREHGARVTEFRWCDDFAAARNAAIEAATTDWVLMLDADERLQPDSGPRLRPLIARAPKTLHCYLPVIDSIIMPNVPDGYVSSRHSRLFRRSEDLRFAGTIHEALRYLPDPLATSRQDAPEIKIQHTGYIPEHYNARGKDQRNMYLLTNWHAADPNDALVHFHTGVQHSAMNRYPETAAAMQRCIELCDQKRPWFLVDAYLRLVNALVAMNDFDAIDRIVPHADRANLLSAKVREVLGISYRKRGLFVEAERHLLSALDPNCVVGLTGHPGAGGWSARLALSDLYEVMVRPADALAQLELALAEPDLLYRGRAARAAARIAFSLGNIPATRRWLAEAKQHADAEYETQAELLDLREALARTWTGRAELGEISELEDALGRRDWQAAYDAALRTSLGDALEAAASIRLADGLHAQGASDAALDVLQRVHNVRPEWPKVYWLLMQVLAALGKYDDALAAAAVLRQLEQPGGLSAAA
ncbi:MAG: hypothetical protein NVSMB2_02030 [Chloroflexota bacterium]